VKTEILRRVLAHRRVAQVRTKFMEARDMRFDSLPVASGCPPSPT
jgi:hypothetical protein